MIRRVTTTRGVYEFDDDPARVDREAVWSFLSGQAYWGRWRTRGDVEKQLDGAWRLVAGYAVEAAPVPAGELVCFARAISDGVAFAYLADVFVDERIRGAGLGRTLVETMIEHGDGARMRWLLHTADAHGLYRRFGFAEPDATLLERPARR